MARLYQNKYHGFVIKLILLVALLPLFAAVAWADPLVGSWNKNGVPASEVRADGTGRIGSDEVRWTADARTLKLTYADGRRETMAYRIEKDVLTVYMDGESETYTRAPAKGAKKSAKAPAETVGSDKTSTMLLSSAWCYFRYNKISGTTHQERVVFRKDGTWDSGKRGETYSSGRNGTAYGQSDSSSGGRWKVKGAALLMSERGGELGDVGLTVTRNSNGYPILHTGGKEYSSCN